MGSAQQLARIAGLLAGAGIVIAAAAPFNGAPPRGVSGAAAATSGAPATLTLRALPTGAFAVEPSGEVLSPTTLAAAGAAAPLVQVQVRNRSPIPQRLQLRIVPTERGLDDAALVRASAAGSVLADGPLPAAEQWSPPSAPVAPGRTTTLRVRVRLDPSAAERDWRGRSDVRQIELQAAGDAAATTTPPGAAG